MSTELHLAPDKNILPQQAICANVLFRGGEEA